MEQLKGASDTLLFGTPTFLLLGPCLPLAPPPSLATSLLGKTRPRALSSPSSRLLPIPLLLSGSLGQNPTGLIIISRNFRLSQKLLHKSLAEFQRLCRVVGNSALGKAKEWWGQRGGFTAPEVAILLQVRTQRWGSISLKAPQEGWRNHVSEPRGLQYGE